MNCKDPIEKFMRSKSKYLEFQYSCYGCYKKHYKHDTDAYVTDLKKYKKKQDRINNKNKNKHEKDRKRSITSYDG